MLCSRVYNSRLLIILRFFSYLSIIYFHFHYIVVHSIVATLFLRLPPFSISSCCALAAFPERSSTAKCQQCTSPNSAGLRFRSKQLQRIIELLRRIYFARITAKRSFSPFACSFSPHSPLGTVIFSHRSMLSLSFDVSTDAASPGFPLSSAARRVKRRRGSI